MTKLIINGNYTHQPGKGGYLWGERGGEVLGGYLCVFITFLLKRREQSKQTQIKIFGVQNHNEMSHHTH